MDVGYFVDAILLGFVVSTALGFLITFGKLFFKFRQEEIIARGEKLSAILRLETVEHKGSDYFLVYEPLKKDRFVTQGATVEEITKFIVANFKGKTVFIVEEGKEMIKLFNYTENV
jgi:hypothetical protein